MWGSHYRYVTISWKLYVHCYPIEEIADVLLCAIFEKLQNVLTLLKRLFWILNGFCAPISWLTITFLFDLSHIQRDQKDLTGAFAKSSIPLMEKLTHRGRVTHICVRKLTIIGSDNGLSPGRRQAIIWTNAGISLIGSLGANFSEILIEIQTFSFKKTCLKM